MSILRTAADYAHRAFDLFLSVSGFLIKKTGEYSLIVWEWFRSLPLAEELIILNGIPAICAVILPAARFYIFESWYEINNPLSVYMIAIGFIMFGTIFFRERVWVLPVRVSINLYYLGWAVYMVASNSITKADSYVITGVYAFNYVVPVIYAGLSVLSFLFARR